jgi:two-component system sensor histidine kinase HydH
MVNSSPTPPEPRPFAGEPVLARAVLQEVSKAAVQEKQLLLARLLARLAHEIRNPLSSLDVHVQLLEEDVARTAPELRDRSANRFRIIRGELERLDNLVKQFLSLAGGTGVDLHSVDVAAIADHVCALLRPEAAAHGVDLVLQPVPALPALRADPAQLTQALVNLVLNALQAVGRDGRVEVAATCEAAREQMVITVRDSGPGIPDGQQGAIFEPFFTTKVDGSGLGLWIVQQIALAHGGNVGVANAPGGGAVFALHLPLRGPEAVHG